MHGALNVYLMLTLATGLPLLGCVQISVIKREKALEVGLRTLRKAGVEGVMVDVWWGIVEGAGPQKYDFSAYRRLFDKVAEHGMKVQAVMSFHAAGGNVGDTCKIPLPPWVLHVGEGNPDIFYTDSSRRRNKEYISLGCDLLPLFWGRTPVQMYSAFIEAFADVFGDLFGAALHDMQIWAAQKQNMRFECCKTLQAASSYLVPRVHVQNMHAAMFACWTCRPVGTPHGSLH